MTTEMIAPITVRGKVVMVDLRIQKIVVDRLDWEFGPIPTVSEYGTDTDVLIFHDPGTDARGDRFEADINIVAPIHEFITNASIEDYPWEAGKAKLEPPTSDQELTIEMLQEFAKEHTDEFMRFIELGFTPDAYRRVMDLGYWHG